MGTTTVRAGSTPDLRLGRLAVRQGIVTAEQVEAALAEQVRDARRRIGEILVAQGHLTDTRLVRLLQEQKEARSADVSLGRILVDRGYVTARQLERCLRAQAEASRPAPMLGDLLVRMGLVTPAEVAEALAIQKKTILACRACGRRANVTAFNPGTPYHCPSCGGELDPLPVLDDVRVSGPSLPAAPAAPGGRPGAGFELGKYTVVRVLGQGGMGVVYEALDTTLNRRVALKMLVHDPDASDPKGDEQRFLREARLWAGLPKHPHVVGVYEAGVIDGRRYLAMEFIEGLPLAKWRAQGNVPVARQVEVLRDAALAAHHAHEQGIVHRDLKPDNVLVDASGRPHLTDFGLAVTADRGPSGSITDTGSVVGTPGYMSPEQARGETRLDRRTDVYALGVMLFEILAGRVPFQGPSSVDVMVRIMTEPVPAPSTLARGPVAPELERICLRATAKDPAARHPTARDFAEDLAGWLRGDSRPVPSRRPARHRRRRW